MRRPPSLTLCLAILVSLVSLGASGASDQGAAGAAEFTLQHIRAADAATALRTIADARRIEVVSDHALRIQGTPEGLQLAEQVLALVDSGTDSALTAFTVPSDQSRVSAFRLERSTAAEALKALRTVVGIAKVAVHQDPALVIVRDTPEQVEAARALIEILEKACP